MENDKFLGIDGIPIEFYKEFIETVKKDLQKNLSWDTLYKQNNTKNMDSSHNNIDTKKRWHKFP